MRPFSAIVQNKGTVGVPDGRFTNVWTAKGYSRLPGWLDTTQALRQLQALGFKQ